MTDDVHPRREALASGEECNGFELWRALYVQHEGGSMHVPMHGIRSFHNSPQCKTLSDLNVHVYKLFAARGPFSFGLEPNGHSREADPPACPTSIMIQDSRSFP